jgi:hypothetical protein
MAGIVQEPPLGYVHLILYEPEHFYLAIPIAIIGELCLKPLKYLRYLGWCVLGVLGTLRDANMDVNLDGNLVDQAVYHYQLPQDQQGFSFALIMKSEADNTIDVLHSAVDLEVIKQCTQVPSQTTGTRDNFKEKLVERDGTRCVWSSLPSGVGMHIIPYKRGDEGCIPCILGLHANHLRSGFNSSLQTGQGMTTATLTV